MHKIWENIKLLLSDKIGLTNFKTWIEPLECSKEEGNQVLNIVCPNVYHKNKIGTKYKSFIVESLKELKQDVDFVLTVDESSKKESLPLLKKTQKVQAKIPEINKYPNMARVLQPSFTFDNFVVGKGSELPYTSILSIVSNEKFVQNSVFLYSETGMGKSHLSQAAANYILASNPNKRFWYITANDFASEMIYSLRNDKMDSFKDKYRLNCDVLIIDNVHSLSKKNATQGELLTTLDYLFNANKKVIFSSLYMPFEIEHLNKNLSSRLSSSLVSVIEKPDFKTRRRILKKKEKKNNVSLPENVRDYLADTLTLNIRELESGFINLITNSNLLSQKIDINLAEKVVNSMINRKDMISVDYIKKVVCKEYGISMEDVSSKSRKRVIVTPRQIAMYLARKYTDQPLESISRSFNKNVGTTIYAINAVESDMKEKKGIYKKVYHIAEKIRES